MPRLKSKSKSKQKAKQQNQSETPVLSRKERSLQKRKAREARQKLFGLTAFCVFFAVAVGVPVGLMAEPKVAMVIALGVPCLVLSYNYPRPALWAFLVYLPFSGTVTYWVGGGNALFQLAKDVFYLPALLGLVMECRKQGKPILIPKNLMPVIGIVLGLSLITLLLGNGSLQLSPKQPGQPFVQGILGLKVLLGYVPLIFCGYYLIEGKKQLLFCSRLHLVLAIACCVLGLLQYSMLTSGRCAGTDHLTGEALFKATLDAKCLVGGSLLYSPSQGVIRLPGTFVSPWHWAWFLIANGALTFVSAFCDSSLFWRLAGLGGMALILVNAAISGQRIALALVPVLIIILLILTGQIANLKRFIPIGVGMALVMSIVVANNPGILQERYDSFVGRWEASPPTAFIEHQFQWAINERPGIFGKGLGRATNSTRAFGRTKLVETFHPKLIYEIGYFGLLGFLALCTRLTMLTFQEYRSVRDKSLRSIGACFWVFILFISYFPYWYPLDTDPVAVYYWFFAGVILKLPEIDKQEQEKLRASLEIESNKKQKAKAARKRAAAKASR
ncbi:MAG: hypothetical protein F6K47_25060 [Symploca sp. SIO2E6]|nr:hypothetical protein [Symploca sp. SIO2E6]